MTSTKTLTLKKFSTTCLMVLFWPEGPSKGKLGKCKLLKESVCVNYPITKEIVFKVKLMTQTKKTFKKQKTYTTFALLNNTFFLDYNIG